MTQERRVAGISEASSSSSAQNGSSSTTDHAARARNRRVQPFNLPRPQREVHTREFTDPLHPDQDVEFSLRAIDSEDEASIKKIAESLKNKYITGHGERHNRPVKFPDVGGHPVRLTEEIITEICRIQVMQSTADPDLPPYDFEELVALRVTMPTLWGSLLQFAEEVNTSLSYVIPDEAPAEPAPAPDPVIATAASAVERRSPEPLSEEPQRRKRRHHRKRKCNHRVKFLSQTCTKCGHQVPMNDVYRLWVSGLAKPLVLVLLVVAIVYGISHYKKVNGKSAAPPEKAVIVPPQ